MKEHPRYDNCHYSIKYGDVVARKFKPHNSRKSKGSPLKFSSFESALQEYNFLVSQSSFDNVNNLKLMYKDQIVCIMVPYESDWDFFRVRFYSHLPELKKLIDNKQFRGFGHMFQ